MDIHQMIMDINEVIMEFASDGCKSAPQFERRKKIIVEAILAHYSGTYGAILGCPPPAPETQGVFMEGLRKLIIVKI